MLFETVRHLNAEDCCRLLRAHDGLVMRFTEPGEDGLGMQVDYYAGEDDNIWMRASYLDEPIAVTDSSIGVSLEQDCPTLLVREKPSGVDGPEEAQPVVSCQ